MCDTLAELEEGLRRHVGVFDASVLTGDDAGRVVRVAATIEKLAATLKGLAAVRAADAGAWKRSGERSAVAELARAMGGSASAARDVLETGRRLGVLPVIAAAARAGRLSAVETSLVASAAAVNPKAEASLVQLATSASLSELRQECARVKAAATDLETRRTRIHANRYLRAYTDSEGAGHLHMRDNPERVAEVMAALEPIRERLFAKAREEGRREPPEGYSADALVELARGTGERRERGKTKVIVRVDLDALLRGYPVGDEVCEIAGFGPVAVSAVRDLLETADPFLAAVVTKGKTVVGVAHVGRRPTAGQQTALEWLYPTCAVEGCGAVARLEMDHTIDWSASRLTVFDLLDRLCPHHHRLKTLEGWRLEEGRGKRRFVPPAHGPPAAA